MNEKAVTMIDMPQAVASDEQHSKEHPKIWEERKNGIFSLLPHPTKKLF
jgi:hypothetical protein